MKNKVIQSTYGRANEPRILGFLEFEMEEVEKFIEKYNKENSDKKINMLGVIIK